MNTATAALAGVTATPDGPAITLHPEGELEGLTLTAHVVRVGQWWFVSTRMPNGNLRRVGKRRKYRAALALLTKATAKAWADWPKPLHVAVSNDRPKGRP